MADLDLLSFFSELNYMKRSISDDVTITTTTTGQAVIDHNLGYIPQFEVGAEVSVDGVLWVGGKVSELTDQGLLSGLGTPPTYIEVDAWATTTQLTIYLSNCANEVVNCSYVIYLDYAT